jgi:exodeoxyribonuclease VII small subunit
MTEKTPSVKDMSFEAALAELESVVRDLEGGKAGLEASIQLYERGVALRQQCEARLKDAQLRIDKLSLDANGKAVLQQSETSK